MPMSHIPRNEVRAAMVSLRVFNRYRGTCPVFLPEGGEERGWVPLLRHVPALIVPLSCALQCLPFHLGVEPFPLPNGCLWIKRHT